MPTYEVDTPQGTFQFDHDSEDPVAAEQDFYQSQGMAGAVASTKRPDSNFPVKPSTAAATRGFEPLADQLGQIDWKNLTTGQVGGAALQTAKQVTLDPLVGLVKGITALPGVAKETVRKGREIDWGGLTAEQLMEATQKTGIQAGKMGVVAAPTILGGAAAGPTGAAAGAAAGTSILKALEAAFGEPSSTGDIATSVLESALGAKVLPGAARPEKFLGRGAYATVPETAAAFERTGIRPSLADITAGGAPKLIENLSGRMIGGVGPIQAQRTAQAAQFEKGLGEVEKLLGPQMDVTQVAEEVGKNVKVAKTRFEKRFEGQKQAVVGAMPEGEVIPRIAQINEAQSMLDKMARTKQPELTKALAPEDIGLLEKAAQKAIPGKTIDTGLVDEFGKPIIRKTPATPLTHETFESWDTTRSLIGEAGREANLVAGRSAGSMKALYRAKMQDLEAALGADSPLFQALKKVDTGYKEWMGKLNKSLPGRIAAEKTAPETITRAFDKASTIRQLQRYAPESFDSVRAAWWTEKLHKAGVISLDKGEAIFNPNAFVKTWDRIPEEVKRATFRETAVRQAIEDHVEVARSFVQKTGGGAYPNASKIPILAYFQLSGVAAKTAGALASFVSGNPWLGTKLLAGATLLLAGPKLGATFATSPRAVKWLTAPPRPYGEVDKLLSGTGSLVGRE